MRALMEKKVVVDLGRKRLESFCVPDDQKTGGNAHCLSGEIEPGLAWLRVDLFHDLAVRDATCGRAVGKSERVGADGRDQREDDACDPGIHFASS